MAPAGESDGRKGQPLFRSRQPHQQLLPPRQHGEGQARAARAIILAAVRGNFQDFLENRKSGQPFFCSFDPTNTHRKWVRGSGKALWNLDPEKPNGKLPPLLPDNPTVRDDMADYLGEAMAFDATCAELIAVVEQNGELDNTLVVISGDHGVPGFIAELKANRGPRLDTDAFERPPYDIPETR